MKKKEAHPSVIMKLSHLVEIGVQHPSVHAFEIHSSADIGFFSCFMDLVILGLQGDGSKDLCN